MRWLLCYHRGVHGRVKFPLLVENEHHLYWEIVQSVCNRTSRNVYKSIRNKEIVQDISSLGGLGGELLRKKRVEVESRLPHGWLNRIWICTILLSKCSLPRWLSRLRGRLRWSEIEDGAHRVPGVLFLLVLITIFSFSQQKDFVELSFATISSTGPNGAIIHYK